MIKIKTCYTVANPKFSLKDSNAEFSAIRMRVFINKVRLNIHLPAEYKIKPCHWDNKKFAKECYPQMEKCNR